MWQRHRDLHERAVAAGAGVGRRGGLHMPDTHCPVAPDGGEPVRQLRVPVDRVHRAVDVARQSEQRAVAASMVPHLRSARALYKYTNKEHVLVLVSNSYSYLYLYCTSTVREQRDSTACGHEKRVRSLESVHFRMRPRTPTRQVRCADRIAGRALHLWTPVSRAQAEERVHPIKFNTLPIASHGNNYKLQQH